MSKLDVMADEFLRDLEKDTLENVPKLPGIRLRPVPAEKRAARAGQLAEMLREAVAEVLTEHQAAS